MSTDSNFNRRLIDLVSQHEVIYNHRHAGHKNRPVVDRLWRSIASELQCSGKFAMNLL